MERVRTPPFEAFPVITTFTFEKGGSLYAGRISGGFPHLDEALRDIRLEGSRLTFLTGKPGGGGAELLTRWSAVVKANSAEGTYTFIESGGSFGNFAMQHSPRLPATK